MYYNNSDWIKMKISTRKGDEVAGNILYLEVITE
jgi:hypothetical protein